MLAWGLSLVVSEIEHPSFIRSFPCNILRVTSGAHLRTPHSLLPRRCCEGHSMRELNIRTSQGVPKPRNPDLVSLLKTFVVSVSIPQSYFVVLPLPRHTLLSCRSFLKSIESRLFPLKTRSIGIEPAATAWPQSLYSLTSDQKIRTQMQ